MNCRAIKKWLPLYTGLDLDSKRISVIDAHVLKCESCRRELAAFQFSSEKMKELLSEDPVNWKESEWKETIKTAVHKPENANSRSSALAPWPYRKSWAWASMAAAALILVVGISKPSLITRLAGLDPENIASVRSLPLWEGEKQSKQDILRVAMISQETGTKLVWFLNKNFNLEESQ